MTLTRYQRSSACTLLAACCNCQLQKAQHQQLPELLLLAAPGCATCEGEQQMMSTVRAVPPSESCSTRVSLESLQTGGGFEAWKRAFTGQVNLVGPRWRGPHC